MERVPATSMIRGGPTTQKNSSFWKKLRQTHQLLVLALPACIFVLVFNYIPLYGLIVAFKNYNYRDGILHSPWSGFENFKFIFTSSDAWVMTRNTLLYNVAFIISTLIVSVTLALLLNQVSKKFIKFHQTALFFPYFISFVIVSYVCLAFLDMNHGFLNTILSWFGKEPVLWYNEPHYWPYILMSVNLWKNAGYYAIIYYTAIISIDSEYFEAAEIDGASIWQQVWSITLPLLKPLMILLVLLQVSRIFFGNFDLFYNVTMNSTLLYPTTDIIDTFVFRALRINGDIGMASAAGFYQSLVGLIIILLTNFVIRRVSKENALF
ncbi:ABC transporter permease subunit [Paenibacillus chondroitinus]|uniref:ABC transporter permease subunit n=1 Tax=Paenibacillus chondroitinus TaxID=59842 RepID=A0ABU6D9U6_9BACL|nr:MULTISPECIES: ABC transporter permease subunit [Paenibacillus]MCY9656819.1 ABC transporter permease subunit [Paenibacillus anseongense]MEB4794469.1 ABC transporter permease subunit [Paenibacillus chondroitinus]